MQLLDSAEIGVGRNDVVVDGGMDGKISPPATPGQPLPQLGTARDPQDCQDSQDRKDSQDWMKASRSALIVGAWVVGIPWGNPGYVLSVPCCTSFADKGPESA